MTVSMPDDHRRSVLTIATMLRGEQGWVVDWAMVVDAAWACWLNGQHTVKQSPGGTVQTWVSRRGDGSYEVHASMPEEGWRRADPPADALPIGRLVVGQSVGAQR